MKRLFAKVKRRHNALWVDVRYVRIFGGPGRYAVWVELPGMHAPRGGRYVATDARSARAALRTAARAEVAA